MVCPILVISALPFSPPALSRDLGFMAVFSSAPISVFALTFQASSHIVLLVVLVSVTLCGKSGFFSPHARASDSVVFRLFVPLL